METPTVKHSSDDFNEKVISTVIFGWQKPLILFSNKAYHRFKIHITAETTTKFRQADW